MANTLRFKVRGSGEFPFDMLRYDGCYPATEADSYQIAARGVREVELEHVCTESYWRGPTEGRWESFTWKVVEPAHAF